MLTVYDKQNACSLGAKKSIGITETNLLLGRVSKVGVSAKLLSRQQRRTISFSFQCDRASDMGAYSVPVVFVGLLVLATGLKFEDNTVSAFLH